MSNLSVEEILKTEKAEKARQKQLAAAPLPGPIDDFNPNPPSKAVDSIIGDLNAEAPKKASEEEPKIAAKPREMTIEEIEAAQAKWDEMGKILSALRSSKGLDGIVIQKAEQPKIDYTKLDESAAFDYSIPIQAITFDLPDYMDIDLKDQNYVARWVNVHPARLGVMRARGFTVIVEEDLAAPLNLAISKDMNGHYRMNDVIAMKIPKSVLYPALRSNHMKSLLMTDPNKLHEISKAKMAEYMQSQGPRVANAWDEAQKPGRNKRPAMEAYIS